VDFCWKCEKEIMQHVRLEKKFKFYLLRVFIGDEVIKIDVDKFENYQEVLIG